MSGISLQINNLLSLPGILKLIEWFCDLLAVILCGAAPTIEGNSGNKGFFLFVSILALIITFVLLIILILNVQQVILIRFWRIIEMCWCLFIALFYFIASIVVAVIAKYSGVYGGAAFFGFAAMIVYIADAINQFRMHRSGEFGQSGQSYAANGTSADAHQRPGY